MARQQLDDAQWSRMAPLLPGEEGSSGVRARDNRQFMETVRGTTVRMSSLRELCALVSYSTVAAI